MSPVGVVFDLDGVLVDTEHAWDAARRAEVEEGGGTWRDEATRAMMGMSSPEWAAYLRDELGVDRAPEAISRSVVTRMEEGLRGALPLLPGAVAAVRALAGRWPLAVASSANREVIDLVLAESGLADAFAASVSSEEVPRGKPAPDVYLEAARRLAAVPADCVAIEDSANGLRSAAAAGMAVIAVPNARFPPDPDALALAAAVVPGVGEVTPAMVAGLRFGAPGPG